jgi:hypothetical protein
VTYDPDAAGPPEYDPEDPAADDDLWAEAAAEYDRWEADPIWNPAECPRCHCLFERPGPHEPCQITEAARVYPHCWHCHDHSMPIFGSETLTPDGEGHTQGCYHCHEASS